MEIIYALKYTKNAIKDVQNLKAIKLSAKVEKLCKSLATNPTPSNSKKLSGDLKGKRSIRINLQHRLVYKIYEAEKIITILSMWSHYDDN
jgi:Txe/YoeB family toxin of toxin-antitoxin system